MLYKHLLLSLTLLLVARSTPIAEGQKLSDYLWNQTAEIRKEALNASLIYGMKAKCLNPSQFGAYIVDDIKYVYEGSKSWKIAGGRAADGNITIQKFLEKEAKKWDAYLESYKGNWHIANTDGIEMGKAVANYVTQIRNVAKNVTLPPVYTIVALTPCAKLWPWIGKQIGAEINNFGVYTSWVKTNLDPNDKGYLKYEALVQWAYEKKIVTADKALEIFNTSMHGEVNFFNSVKRCDSTSSFSGSTSNGPLLFLAFFSTVARMIFNN